MQQGQIRTTEMYLCPLLLTWASPSQALQACFYCCVLDDRQEGRTTERTTVCSHTTGQRTCNSPLCRHLQSVFHTSIHPALSVVWPLMLAVPRGSLRMLSTGTIAQRALSVYLRSA